MAEAVQSAQHARDAPQARWRRLFWDGVLPEALGLCFVLIILSGFAANYIIADRLWTRQVRAAERSELQTQARTLAAALGTAASTDTEAAVALLHQTVGLLPQVRSLRWEDPNGAVRFAWPPPLPTAVAPPAPDQGGSGLFADTPVVDVRTAVLTRTGAPAGTLQIAALAKPPADPTFILWNCGIAAAVTLVVFVGFYHRLRRHLRPMAAIERNLRVLATGVDAELLTLTLSESLGNAARGWNRLLTQLVDLQQQIQSVQVAGATQGILERFESATFRRVVDRLPHGVLWVNESQVVAYANPGAAALLGHAPDQIEGQELSSLLDNPAVLQAVSGARKRADVGLVVDHTQRRGEQETTLRFRVVPLSDQVGDGDVLVTVEDISQLRESQRARDNFLYHVTHELRTPLTNIHAYAETLTRPGFDDEQTRKECYNVLISETERLSRLVEDILSISQMEVGTARLDIGDVDLARLVRQMVQDNLGRADEKRIDLTLALPPKVPKIRGDKQRLCVLLNNLIGNALKYTPENGKVHVSVETTGTCVRIAVADTGIGIAPEDQAHVFDKFYRAANEVVQAVPGTGLGLALAREVARLHGGEIYLQSELGKGSTFTVELPLPAPSPAEVNSP